MKNLSGTWDGALCARPMGKTKKRDRVTSCMRTQLGANKIDRGALAKQAGEEPSSDRRLLRVLIPAPNQDQQRAERKETMLDHGG
jgi:hypothetical protein